MTRTGRVHVTVYGDDRLPRSANDLNRRIYIFGLHTDKFIKPLAFQQKCAHIRFDRSLRTDTTLLAGQLRLLGWKGEASNLELWSAPSMICKYRTACWQAAALRFQMILQKKQLPSSTPSKPQSPSPCVCHIVFFAIVSFTRDRCPAVQDLAYYMRASVCALLCCLHCKSSPTSQRTDHGHMMVMMMMLLEKPF